MDKASKIQEKTVVNEKEKFFQEIWKKVLTKGVRGGILIKRLRHGGAVEKKSRKNEKVLDKVETVC